MASKHLVKKGYIILKRGLKTKAAAKAVIMKKVKRSPDGKYSYDTTVDPDGGYIAWFKKD